jgi:hypothetical protein
MTLARLLMHIPLAWPEVLGTNAYELLGPFVSYEGNEVLRI